MKWLKEHGLISDWWQYHDLPVWVIEDCQMVMEVEAAIVAQESNGRRS